MKNKIIYANSDKKTGISTVCIQNKYGKFWGFSFCSPEDLDTFSEYAGQRYAETRAAAEFAKHRMKQEKLKLKTITDFINDFYCNSDYNAFDLNNNPLYNHAFVLQKNYAKNVKHWKEVSELLLASVSKQDKERQDILLRSKKNK